MGKLRLEEVLARFDADLYLSSITESGQLGLKRSWHLLISIPSHCTPDVHVQWRGRYIIDLNTGYLAVSRCC